MTLCKCNTKSLSETTQSWMPSSQASERRLHFEFHHLSGAHCTPNKMAKYMMKKLRVYAIQYNLIER